MNMTNSDIANIYDCDIKWADKPIDAQKNK